MNSYAGFNRNSMPSPPKRSRTRLRNSSRNGRRPCKNHRPNWNRLPKRFRQVFRATAFSPPRRRPCAPAQVFQTRMRYDVAGRKVGASFEERVGAWNFEWERDSSGKLWIRKWQGISQTRSRAERPIFRDVTAASLGKNRSYQEQLLRGADHWRTVLDGASGIDVYGNNGVAAGDFNNDGLDDLYVCQPSGLPNRL